MQKLHWIDSEKLTEFILACQDAEKGGFSDRPEDESDIFHTCFALAGLSLLAAAKNSLEEIDPALFVQKSIAEKILPRF
jgi:geranylgeranyl transferase type-2 subunit beta